MISLHFRMFGRHCQSTCWCLRVSVWADPSPCPETCVLGVLSHTLPTATPQSGLGVFCPLCSLCSDAPLSPSTSVVLLLPQGCCASICSWLGCYCACCGENGKDKTVTKIATDRNCTDIGFLLLYIAGWAAVLAIMIVALNRGANINRYVCVSRWPS